MKHSQKGTKRLAEMLAPSPFTYEKGMKIKSVKYPFSDEKGLPGEKILINTLFKYTLLTRPLIEKNFKAYGHERIDTDRLIESMLKRRIISRYRVSGDEEKGCDFYMLTVKESMDSFGIVKKRPKNATQALESLALSQYHMSALLYKDAREYRYDSDETEDDHILTIPSMIRLKKQPSLTLSALCAPRINTDRKMRAFYKKIVQLNDYMKLRTSFRSYGNIVVCESTGHAYEIARFLDKMPYTKDMLILYTTDRDCSMTDGKSCLENLRSIRTDEKINETGIIDLTFSI